MRADELWLTDVSPLMRCGLKGRAAMEWLRAHDLPVPEDPNTWSVLPADSDGWSLIARLGNTEFLLEEAGDATCIHRLGTQLQTDVAGVYPVLREDAEFALGGALAATALTEVCNVDFARIDRQQRNAVLTMMAGVAVLVIPQADGDQSRYRIWCDPSFGAYLWTTLKDVIAHHSGVILGLGQLAAPPRLPPTIERIAR